MQKSAYMGSKNISLREEVYEELKREKADDESFSDTVSRLLSVRHDEEPHPLYGLIGMLDEDEAEEVRERVEEFRADVSEEMEETRKEI